MVREGTYLFTEARRSGQGSKCSTTVCMPHLPCTFERGQPPLRGMPVCPVVTVSDLRNSDSKVECTFQGSSSKVEQTNSPTRDAWGPIPANCEPQRQTGAQPALTVAYLVAKVQLLARIQR